MRLDKLYEESIRILTTNKALCTRVKDHELEKEKVIIDIRESLNKLNFMNKSLDTRVKNLVSDLEESSRRVSELSILNKSLEIRVKTFMNDLDDSTQLTRINSSTKQV